MMLRVITSCVCLIIFLGAVEAVYHASLNSETWADYKTTHNKVYDNRSAEMYALFAYNSNMKMITRHNTLFDRGQRLYKLAPNQFTDRKHTAFFAHFPVAVAGGSSFASTMPTMLPAAPDFLPAEQVELRIIIEDQGTVCNSGWAYASAKAIEVRRALQMSSATTEKLSAQYLIDCAGQSIGCKNQSPFAAFNFLQSFKRPAYYTTDYPNQPLRADQGTCYTLPSPLSAPALYLKEYTTTSTDAQMTQLISNLYPVVVEYNPTSFEFMHYSEGIFQQPKKVGRGSHFMLVVGYTNEYWLVANSFGTTWGEAGFIKIRRSNANPLAMNSLVPTVVDIVPAV